MTQPLPPEPHDGIKADTSPEVQGSESEASPGLSRAGSSGTLTTGPEPGDEQPSQALDGGTAAGDPLSGVTATEQDSDDAVSGDRGPEHPGARS
ncbi:MAG: hypothetical protein JWN88_3198 [Frankiales bacterium]|jgi:hypothetical protein|nr:hypothetical protein [Frankiales bacterium]